MAPDELTIRAVAHRMGSTSCTGLACAAEEPCGYPVPDRRQPAEIKVVAKHDGYTSGLHAHASRHILAGCSPSTSAPRLCRQGWYRTREQQADLPGEPPGPFEPIERDLGPVVAAVWAVYEGIVKNACAPGWTLEQAALEFAARLQVVSLGHHRRERR